MSSVSNIVLPTYGADQQDIDRLNEALDTLAANSDIANFINGDRSMLFQGKVYFDFRDLYTYRGSQYLGKVDYMAAVHLDDGMSLWNYGLIPFTAGIQQYSNQQPDIQTGVIVVKPSQVDDMDSGSFSVSGYNGNFSASFERALLHEFSHLLYHGRDLYSDLTKSATDPSYVTNGSLSYQEAMAIATENFLYLPLARASTNLGDEQYRMGTGHDRSRFTPGGISGIEPFESISGPRTINVSKSGVIDFVSKDTATSTTLTMSFYDRAHSVAVSGTLNAEYDHYIKYTLESSSPQSKIVSLGAAVVQTNFAAGNVAIASLVADATPISFGLGALLNTSARLSFLGTIPAQSDVTAGNAVIDILNGVERMVSLSASRFVYDSDKQDKVYDITGPVVHEWNEPDSDGIMHAYYVSPSVIAIDESSAGKGTLILGASGYDDRYISPTERAVGTINLIASVDRLVGTNAGDVIVSGNGFKSGSANVSYGGAGDDILIGREGNDNLHGDIGNDILIGGLGYNLLNGGNGFDIVSYADRTESMVINMNDSVISSTGTYDVLSQIESVIGSSGPNTFYGNGKTVLIGGTGNDTFFLKPGDVVFGGGGQDTYILSYGGTIPNVTERYAIMDLGADDFIMAPYWTGMGGPSSTSQYTYSIHHDIRAGQPDRISAEVQSYNVTMPQPGITGTTTWTPAAKWIAYEIYTNDGTVASPFDFSFPGNVDVYGARGQYDFNRIFDLRPAGVTGSALSDRLIMTDASPSGIYDSGGGQDIASYENKYWGGFYSGVTVSVNSNGIVNSYLVDTGAAQHEFRGFAGVEGTAYDDTFEVSNIAGTNGILTGGDGRDLISLTNTSGGYVVDLDNSRITYQGASLSYSGMNRIDLGTGNTFVHSGGALAQGVDIILRAGIHSIDLVEGMHLRPVGYDAKVTVNVQAAYDPSFNLANVLASGGANSFYSSTALSTVDGGNTHIVFNETFSGTMTITQDYGGFLRLGNVFFRQISDVFFEADAIDLDLSGLAYNGYGNTLYGAHEHSKIIGSGSRDTIYGRGAMGDELHGGAGDDVIYASDSGSLLFGDSGNDWLYGGEGDDQIHSGTGYDYLMGRGGNDTFFFEGASGGSVSGNKMTTSPEGLDSGFDTVNFDFAFSDVISITSTVYTQIGTPTFDTLATEIQTIHGTFSLFDCDWMTFAGQNGMAITPTYDYHI